MKINIFENRADVRRKKYCIFNCLLTDLSTVNKHGLFDSFRVIKIFLITVIPDYALGNIKGKEYSFEEFHKPENHARRFLLSAILRTSFPFTFSK